MERTEFFMRPYIVSFLVFFVLQATLSFSFAQTSKKFQEHDVIELADGTKMEILKSRGEGESEEWNVIYYSDQRQNGKRVWEKTSKIRELQLAALKQKQEEKNQQKKNRTTSTPLEESQRTTGKATLKKGVIFKDSALYTPPIVGRTNPPKAPANKGLTTSTTTKSPEAGSKISLPNKNQGTSAPTKPVVKTAPKQRDSLTVNKNSLTKATPKKIAKSKDTIANIPLASKKVFLPKATPRKDSIANIFTSSKKIPAKKPTSIKDTIPVILSSAKKLTVKKTSSSKDTIANILASAKKAPSKKTILIKDTIPNPLASKKDAVKKSLVLQTPAKNSPAETINKPITTNKIAPNINKTNNATKVPSNIFPKRIATDTTVVHVAVFAPIFVDDAFSGSTYNLGKTNLPKNILPGLEFYNGVMLAVDSLSAEGANVEISIYDTKQTSTSLADILKQPGLNNIGLVIAAITNIFELKLFSEFALSKNIPLISANYPNATGVNNNPFFVLLNSSFPVHLDGLYKHMLRFYSSNNIIAIKQPGTTEDFIKNYITNLNKNARPVPLNIKWVDLKEGFTPLDVTKYLDSTKDNVVFVASPLESFGLKVVRTLSATESYHCTAIGMPTWDGIKELNNRDCRNVEIVFSTPFVYNSHNYNLSTELVKKYRDKYYSRPSDMVFRGYETTYHFTKLLGKYKNNLINNLSDKDFTLFNQFSIEPVKSKKSSLQPDFLENKKLYFIKKQNGIIKSVI